MGLAWETDVCAYVGANSITRANEMTVSQVQQLSSFLLEVEEALDV